MKWLSIAVKTVILIKIAPRERLIDLPEIQQPSKNAEPSAGYERKRYSESQPPAVGRFDLKQRRDEGDVERRGDPRACRPRNDPIGKMLWSEN
jgi:hypothetical protein